MENTFCLKSILSGLGFIVIGSSLVNIGVPARAFTLGFDTATVGIFTGLYYLGFAVSCFKTPWLVKRAGHIRAFICVCASFGICTLGYAVTTHPLFWGVFRLVGGFCMASVYMIAESWTNEVAEDSNRSKILTVYRVVDLSSIVVGQLLIGSFDIDGNMLFMASNIIITAGVIPLALTTQLGPKPIHKVNIDWRKIFGVSRIAMLTAILVGMANSSFFGLAPLFAQSSGLSVPQTGFFMSIPLITGVLFQLFLGPLADRYDRERLMSLLMLCAAACAFFVAFFVHQLPILFLAAGLWGGFSMPLYSFTIAIANDRGTADDFLDISGGLLLMFSFGAVVGPTLVSVVMQYAGNEILYFIIAAIQLVNAAYVITRRNLSIEPVDIEEREDYLVVPRTTPAIFEMDPRNED